MILGSNRELVYIRFLLSGYSGYLAGYLQEGNTYGADALPASMLAE